MRSFDPQLGARELAPHPNRLELVATRRGLVFPQLCPACGETAVGWLDVPKVFMRHHDDSPWTYVTAHCRVPFCAACIDRHEAERERQTLAQQLRRALFSEMAIPVFCAGLTGLFFLKETLGRAARGGSGVLVLGGMTTFCLVIAGASALTAWTRTARYRVPPQTSVTRAFDYSDDVSEMFDDTRHVYTIQNADFADALARLNADAVWDAGAPRALEAERRRWVVSVVVVAVAVVAVIWGFVQDW